MGFSVDSFLNSASKTITDRAVSGVTNAVDNALGGKGYTDLALSVLSSGSSLSTLTSIASLKFDQILDKAATDWFSKLKGDILGAGKGRTAGPLLSLPNAGSKGTLKFPPDLGSYAFVLQFAKYRRPVPLAPSTEEFTQTIYLPLPRELTGGQDMSIQTPETGTFGTMLDAAVLASRNQSATDGTVLSAVDPIMRAGAGFADLLTGGMVSTLGEQSVGATFNPNLSVAYKGPTLREFSFTWEFSPNNVKESDTVQQIVKELQKRSLAAYSVKGTSAYLSYPEMLIPKVVPNDKPGSIGDLMKFKKCMIKSVHFNYAPNGIPSFFKGTKAPQFISVSMSIQEIEYFVSSDFGGAEVGEFSNDVKELGSTITNIFDKITGQTNTPENQPGEK